MNSYLSAPFGAQRSRRVRTDRAASGSSSGLAVELGRGRCVTDRGNQFFGQDTQLDASVVRGSLQDGERLILHLPPQAPKDRSYLRGPRTCAANQLHPQENADAHVRVADALPDNTRVSMPGTRSYVKQKLSSCRLCELDNSSRCSQLVRLRSAPDLGVGAHRVDDSRSARCRTRATYCISTTDLACDSSSKLAFRATYSHILRSE